MAVIVTPRGGAATSLDTLSPPTYTLTEQGGFADATVQAQFDRNAEMRLASASIDERWFGTVRSTDGDTITMQGQQARLEDVKAGRVYATHDLSAWQPTPRKGATDKLNVATNEDDEMVWTWADGTAYKDGAYNGFIYYLPASQAVTLQFTHTAFSANYTLEIRSGAAGDVTHTYTNQSAGTKTITVDASYSLQILIKRDAGTPSGGDWSVTLTDVSITHANGATLAAIVGDIADLAGTLVPMRDLSACPSHTFDELVFGAETSLLSMLDTVLAHGDWRCYFEPRIEAGVTKPCLVVATRPTTAAYTLTEGSGDGYAVTVELGAVSADPLANVVRCLYTTKNGVTRYTDVTDTNTSHTLYGLTPPKMAVIDTGQTNATDAAALGTRWLVDGSRDQYQATVTIEGAPGGRQACDHRPGDLVTVTTKERGTITARITSGTYTGTSLAVLTLDNAPNLTDLLARLIEKR